MNEENIAIPSKLRIGYQDVYYAIRQHNRKLKEDASQGSDKFDQVGQAPTIDNGEGSSHTQDQDRKQELPVITESSIRSSLPASAAASVPTNAPIVSDATSQFLNDVLQAARQEAEAANQAKLK
jgi:hypothetical protein